MEELELPPLEGEEVEQCFGWHALNYRTAATPHAEEAFQALTAFVRSYAAEAVRRAVEAERERIRGAALEHGKFHRWEADPSIPDDIPSWEWFDHDVTCDDCTEAVIIPVAAIRSGLKKGE